MPATVHVSSGTFGLVAVGGILRAPFDAANQLEYHREYFSVHNSYLPPKYTPTAPLTEVPRVFSL